MIKSNYWLNDNILVRDVYKLEKMEDVFADVIFKYDDYMWHGAIPVLMIYQGFKINNQEEFEIFLTKAYTHLDPSIKNDWDKDKTKYWSSLKKGPTYDVLNALNSGKWECRVCGPVPNANPQPSARLRDLKKMGYTIASKRIACSNCNKSTMHDILVKIERFDIERGAKGRSTISKKLRERIIKQFGNVEACFDSVKTNKELVVDHKFPSQRWEEQEGDNPNTMTSDAIKNKFQLLSNQTNLLKSRYCDKCVKENIRGDFMGIKWYYKGNHKWEGLNKSDENGCVGCPWYDINKWREELHNSL